MPQLTYKDLKYRREDKYFTVLQPLYKQACQEMPALSNFLVKDIADFYHLLSNAIRIDNHPNIEIIKQVIGQKYGHTIPIRVFLYESILPKAMCTQRKFYENQREKRELLILVSQHFFNYLDFQEQVAILSHELCHLILGHLTIPARHILQSTFDFGKARELRINLLKWSLCAEISSDIFALHASDFNPKVFSSAIIKFSSGVHALDSFDLISILLRQYDDLAERIHNSDLTPHPVLPLRIKVINEVCRSEMIQYIGKEVTKEKHQQLINDYNNLIDEIVFQINPELFDERRKEDHELYLYVAVAVILSDEKISEEELALIRSLNHRSKDSEVFVNEVREQVKKFGYEQVITENLKLAEHYCRRHQFTNAEVIPVVRFMLHVAATDNVELSELNTVYRFAQHFNISREEIVVLLNQISG